MDIIKSDDFVDEMIHSKLRGYNRNFMDNLKDYSFHIEEDEKIIAGIVAGSTYNTLEIDYLYVDEKYRNQGLGSKLLKHVEECGKNDGLKFVLVNTYSFQAPEFYIKNNYELLYKLEKCFLDYDQYFFRKELK